MTVCQVRVTPEPRLLPSALADGAVFGLWQVYLSLQLVCSLWVVHPHLDLGTEHSLRSYRPRAQLAWPEQEVSGGGRLDMPGCERRGWVRGFCEPLRAMGCEHGRAGGPHYPSHR